MYRSLSLAFALSIALTACGPGGSNNGNNGNNGMTNNASNVDPNNSSNSSNVRPNNSNSSNVDPNSATNNPTNNGTNNPTNNASNNPTNNATNNPTNNQTNNQTTGDDILYAHERALWDEICDVIFECSDSPTASLFVTFYGGQYSDAADCKANPSASIVDPELHQSIDEGRTTIDDTALMECVTAAGDYYCDGNGTSTGVNSACQDVFQGTVAEGGDCITAEDCAAGTCDIGQGDCAGTCAPGSDCFGNTCDDTQYCDDVAQDCVDLKADGETCEGNGQCADGLGCYFADANASDGTCTPFGSAAQGDYCDVNSDCADGLVCTLDDTCEPYMLLADGEECEWFGDFPCEPGLACTDIDDTTFLGTCGAPQGDGESCFWDAECELGLWCDNDAGSCTPLLADGATCADDGECSTGYCAFADPDDATGTCETPGIVCPI